MPLVSLLFAARNETNIDTVRFTMLFSLLITYCVSMLFNISNWINDPFGYDVHDIKLNALCTTISKYILEEFLETGVDIDSLIDAKRSEMATEAGTEAALPFQVRSFG